jgi:hypothetical protein
LDCSGRDLPRYPVAGASAKKNPACSAGANANPKKVAFALSEQKRIRENIVCYSVASINFFIPLLLPAAIRRTHHPQQGKAGREHGGTDCAAGKSGIVKQYH